MPPAILYARVSSKEQEREGYSIPAQLALISEYAHRKGLELTETFFEAETAKSSGRERFAEMLEYIAKQKKPVVLLCEKTDRLYRNFKDHLAIDELIASHDLEVHLVKENVILGRKASSHDKLIHGIKVVLAKNYIDNLSEEIKKGRNQKLLSGGWPHKAPYGYRNEKKAVVINPETAPFVRAAFALYATGVYSLERLAAKLHDDGLIYKETLPRVSKPGLGKLLANPFYMGEMEIDGVIYPGSHEPLVSVEIWRKAQRAGKSGKSLQYGTLDFKYGRMLTCFQCGGAMVGEEKKAGRYIYYRCARNKRGCPQKYIRQDVVDKAFEAFIQSLLVDDGHKEIIHTAVQAMSGALENTGDDELREAQAALQRARTNYRKALQEKIEGRLDDEMWAMVSADYQETIRNMGERAQRVGDSDVSFSEKVKRLVELPDILAHKWPTLKSVAKLVLLNDLGSNYKIEGEKLHYELKEPFTLLSKTALRQAWWEKHDELRITMSLHSGVIEAMARVLAA